MVIAYLALIELGKRRFYGTLSRPTPVRRRYSHPRHLRRRAAYFSYGAARPAPRAARR